jgi:hypothetical protein
MTFPANCIKGIPNKDFIDNDSVGSNLFYFLLDDRGDGWIEQSVNWEEDDSVIDFTLQQRKGDSFHFKIGVAVVPRKEIDRINSLPTVKGLLSYERQPITGNPYHGNILLKAITSRPMMKKIAAGIALVSEVIRR